MKARLILPRIIRKKEESNCVDLFFDSQKNAQEILKNYLENRYDLIFHEDGECKGFAKCFHNNKCVDSLSDFVLDDGDELEIITSMSGG